MAVNDSLGEVKAFCDQDDNKVEKQVTYTWNQTPRDLLLRSLALMKELEGESNKTFLALHDLNKIRSNTLPTAGEVVEHIVNLHNRLMADAMARMVKVINLRKVAPSSA